MRQFEITLKNEKVKLYTQLSWLIIFINIVVFIYLAFFAAEKNTKTATLASLILLAICFILKFYFRNTKYKFGLRPFFIFLMAGWLGMENYWLFGVVALFDLLYSISVIQLIVRLKKENIVYPSFPSKTIKWSELSNVLLKDGLFTMDFKNNKIIQQMIDESKTVADEKEFNDFCKEQLKAAAISN